MFALSPSFQCLCSIFNTDMRVALIFPTNSEQENQWPDLGATIGCIQKNSKNTIVNIVKHHQHSIHYFDKLFGIFVHKPAPPALVGLWEPPPEPTFLCREACGGDSIPLSLREAVAAARAWLPRFPPAWYMALGLDTGTATCMEKLCWGNAVGWRRETNTQIFTQNAFQIQGLMNLMGRRLSWHH